MDTPFVSLLCRASRLLDWLLVFLAVALLVLLCQFLVSFFKDTDDTDAGD